jgi:hypothetical protein
MHMRTLITTVLVLTLAACPALAQIQIADESGPAPTRVPTTLKYLNERIDQVSFEEAPLDQVISWIANLTPMNVVVRWQTLEDV